MTDLKPECRASGRRKRSDRKSHLTRKFGLTLEEYDAMRDSQGGRCAICRRKPRKVSLHVDHDPKTQKLVALARARALALRS
jgi:hypothetical protein